MRATISPLSGDLLKQQHRARNVIIAPTKNEIKMSTFDATASLCKQNISSTPALAGRVTKLPVAVTPTSANLSENNSPALLPRSERSAPEPSQDSEDMWSLIDEFKSFNAVCDIEALVRQVRQIKTTLMNEKTQAEQLKSSSNMLTCSMAYIEPIECVLST